MISEHLEALLQELEKSGASQKLGVADCLRTIASNGGEQETDEFIAACADAMGQAAMYLRNKLCGIYTEDMRDQYYEDWMASAGSGDTHRGFSDWVYMQLCAEPTDDDEYDGCDIGDTQS